MKIWVSSSAVPLSLARPFMAGWNKNRYKDIFAKYGAKYRIYIPVDHKAQKPRASALTKAVEKALNKKGYTIIDYAAGLASELEGKRTMRIGKLIADDGALSKKFAADPVRAATKATKMFVVISRHPYDILGASFDRGWTSCTHLTKGQSSNVVKRAAKVGCLVAYMVKNDDKNINNPTSRVLISPYVDGRNFIFGISSQVYGTANQSFVPTVRNFLDEINKSKPKGDYLAIPNINAETVSRIRFKQPLEANELYDFDEISSTLDEAIANKNIPRLRLLSRNPFMQEAHILALIKFGDVDCLDTLAHFKNHTEKSGLALSRAIAKNIKRMSYDAVDALVENLSMPRAVKVDMLRRVARTYNPSMLVGDYIDDLEVFMTYIGHDAFNVLSGTALIKFYDQSLKYIKAGRGNVDRSGPALAQKVLDAKTLDPRVIALIISYVSDEQLSILCERILKPDTDLAAYPLFVRKCLKSIPDKTVPLLLSNKIEILDTDVYLVANYPDYIDFLVQRVLAPGRQVFEKRLARQLLLLKTLPKDDAESIRHAYPSTCIMLTDAQADQQAKEILGSDISVRNLYAIAYAFEIRNKVFVDAVLEAVKAEAQQPIVDIPSVKSLLSRTHLSGKQKNSIIDSLGHRVFSVIPFDWCSYGAEVSEEDDFCYHALKTLGLGSTFARMTVTERSADLMVKGESTRPIGSIWAISVAAFLKILPLTNTSIKVMALEKIMDSDPDQYEQVYAKALEYTDLSDPMNAQIAVYSTKKSLLKIIAGNLRTRLVGFIAGNKQFDLECAKALWERRLDEEVIPPVANQIVDSLKYSNYWIDVIDES